MTPVQLRDARYRLGDMWNLGRPLKASEMGRALGLSGRDPGQSVLDYESERATISKTGAILVRVYLNGALPPDGIGCIYKGD